MLTAKPQLNLRNAREYFREHLSVGDYYSAGQKVTGEWFGQGAENLGLNGPVAENEFLRLCEGLHPATGERLTQRKNSSRRGEKGRTVANRRVFYDFTLSPPKSVSVVGLYRIHEHHPEFLFGALRDSIRRIRQNLFCRGERLFYTVVHQLEIYRSYGNGRHM